MSCSFGCKSAAKWSLGLLASLGIFMSVCHGQSAAPPRYVVKKSLFHLPFKLDPANMADVREMDLWMRDGAGQWRVMDRVSPTAKYFTCQVPQDGEYGFSIVMVDRNGRSSPANVMTRPPELIVQVDTRMGSAPMTMPPPTLKFSGTQAIPEINDTMSEPAMMTQETQAPSTTELPAFSSESLHDAVMQHDAETSVSSAGMPTMPTSMPATMPTTMTSQGGLLVNKTHVNIDYNIKKVGPSGVSKIEVYATTDQGLSWKSLGVDTDLHSPLKINLPGEGVYGIRMVGVNGNGFGGQKPNPGDRPNTIIEVDLTGPKVQDWRVVAGKNGNLDVYWNVSDKNIAAEPITLYYRTRANENWKPMTPKMKNTGSYHWPISRDLAAQYFVRLEASDRAGNVSTCETTNPILVDRTEPEINIQGVTVTQSLRPDEPGLVLPVEGAVNEN